VPQQGRSATLALHQHNTHIKTANCIAAIAGFGIESACRNWVHSATLAFFQHSTQISAGFYNAAIARFGVKRSCTDKVRRNMCLCTLLKTLLRRLCRDHIWHSA
jgi:hypothetical protein